MWSKENPMRFASLCLAALSAFLVLTASARADEPNYSLGTSLVLFSPTQITSPNYGWWGDLLPLDYSYGMINLVNAVNESRKQRGVSDMVDVKTYPIAVGGEMQVEGGFEYNIDFNKMSPEDVNAVLAAFPLTGKLSDLKQTLRPVNYGYYYASSYDGSPAVMDIGGEKISITWGESYEAVWNKVNAVLGRVFGASTTFDLGMNQYSSANSDSRNLDVNVSVYLNGSSPGMPGTPRPYEGEGGM
jgi:hypothetical protein